MRSGVHDDDEDNEEYRFYQETADEVLNDLDVAGGVSLEKGKSWSDFFFPAPLAQL